MPIYEYRCLKCGRIQEELVLNGWGEPKTCKECGGELERLLPTGVGFVFKGSGFYETDYKRKERKEDKKEESPGED
jgi:putative FmdB family regulatory protein